MGGGGMDGVVGWGWGCRVGGGRVGVGRDGVVGGGGWW